MEGDGAVVGGWRGAGLEKGHPNDPGCRNQTSGKVHLYFLVLSILMKYLMNNPYNSENCSVAAYYLLRT